MAGEGTRILWGLVYLFGLAGTHYALGQGMLSETMAIWIWLVLFLISGFSIGRSFGVKFSAGGNMVWMQTNILFAILVVTMLAGLWSGGAAVFFALFYLLMGAGIFAHGHETHTSPWVWNGLAYLALGIVFPAWFAGVPFLAAALISGIPLIVGSIKSGQKGRR